MKTELRKVYRNSYIHWHIMIITNKHLMKVSEEKSREIGPKLFEKLAT